MIRITIILNKQELEEQEKEQEQEPGKEEWRRPEQTQE
jgi:hypothetical protein